MIKDLAEFTKIKSTPHMTILRHPSGHEIRIAHAGLGESLKKQLHEMPVHLADGTPDGPIDNSGSPEQLANIESQIAQTPAQEPVPEESTAHAIGRNIGAIGKMLPTPAPVAFAKGVAEQGGKFLSGLTGEGESAASQEPDKTQPKLANYQLGAPQQGEAAAPISEAPKYTSPYEQQAAIAQQKAQSDENLQKWAKGHMDAIDKERTDLQEDIRKGHIDPNQYIHEMGTGQRVATAIGLLFGGLGAGATGGKNVAMDFLNQQIEKNVNGQIADLGKKQNLLTALTHQFGNVRDASDMFRAIQNDHYASQIQAAMTQAQDPVKKQQMLMAFQQFQNQAHTSAQKVALRQGAQSAAKSGQINPETAINILYGDNPKLRDEASKHLDEWTNMSASRNEAMKSFDEISRMKTVAGSLNPHTRSLIKSNEAPVLSLARDASGRINEFEIPFIQGLFPVISDGPKEIAYKRQKLAEFVSKKMQTHEQFLGGLGIQLPNASATQARPNMNVTPTSRGPAPMKVNYNGG